MLESTWVSWMILDENKWNLRQMNLERYGSEIWPIKYSIRNEIRVVELDYKLQSKTDE